MMEKFAHPNVLLEMTGETLKKLGAEKFLGSPEEEAHKGKEAFFAYFFLLTLKAHNGRDHWVSQPEGFPDLKLVSFGDKAKDTRAYSFELVTIPPICSTFEDVLSIVRGKFEKRYSITNENLLIFLNHKEGPSWVSRLHESLEGKTPFNEIWTCHLLFKPGGKEVKKAIAYMLRPVVVNIEADMEDPAIFRPQPIPKTLEPIEINGVKCVSVRKEVMDEIKQIALKVRLGKE